MQTQTYAVKGMHCASCAGIIEKALKKMAGVSAAQVNVAAETGLITFDETRISPEELSEQIEPLGYSLIMPASEETKTMDPDEHTGHIKSNQSKKEKLSDLADMRTKVISSIPIAGITIIIMAWDALAAFGKIPDMPKSADEFIHHLLPVFATYALFVIGKPYLLGLYRFLRHGAANMDTLIGMGTLAAFLYSFIATAFEQQLSQFIDTENTYYDVTIVVITFITLGKYLEAKAKIKTSNAIEKLLNLQAKIALVIKNGKEQEVPINLVVHGDHIIIKPGARIPVDGVITEGSSFVDESMVTGESMPMEKKAGDSVVAGTINTTGSFVFKAEKVGSETLLAHIIKMVEAAQGSKAPIQALADKISSVFVPIVLGLSFVTLGAWLLFGTQALGFEQALSYGLASFVGILVIACPCALGLATPTAIIVGIGKAAQEGILVKDAATLEKLHRVDAVVVDKTGTITKGKPELTDITSMSGMPKEKIISILAGLEAKSEHPIAHAILSYARENNIPLLPASGFEIIKGKGLKAVIEETEYIAGNMALIEERNLAFDRAPIALEASQGKTPILLADNNAVLGVVMVADAIKPEAIAAIKDLRALNIKTIMLTGDHPNTANAIAKEAGIDEVMAQALPEDKFKKIKELQSQGLIIAMAGDGINDAPALAQADVGIAMGTGTDVAIETAGITLLHGDISKLVKAIRLSRFTMRGIRQNLFWAFIYNIIGIPLAGGLFYPMFGWLLNPIFAGLAMAFSSVSVVANSLRLKTKKI